eukprot:3595023-Amphidinium_carterae.3
MTQSFDCLRLQCHSAWSETCLNFTACCMERCFKDVEAVIALKRKSIINHDLAWEGETELKAFSEYNKWCDDTAQQLGFDIKTATSEKAEAQRALSGVHLWTGHARCLQTDTSPLRNTSTVGCVAYASIFLVLVKGMTTSRLHLAFLYDIAAIVACSWHAQCRTRTDVQALLCQAEAALAKCTSEEDLAQAKIGELAADSK